MAKEIQMPQITMTMTEGIVRAWHKKKGDSVQKGEPLVDIETDKVVQTLDASTSGTLTEILAHEGDTVPVGKAICVVNLAGEPPTEDVPQGNSSQHEPEPQAVAVTMPHITMTMIEGTVVHWYKKKGDAVVEGEPLADIETDKMVQTLNAATSGTLLETLVDEGAVVPVDQTICLIATFESAIAGSVEPQPPSFPLQDKGSGSTAPSSSKRERVITMPRLSPHGQDAVVLRWLCKEGSNVTPGEPLCEVEIEDRRQVVTADAEGQNIRFMAYSGYTLSPGEPIYSVTLGPTSLSAPGTASGICASPWAKHVASQARIDLFSSEVVPTGPDGMIVGSDVEKVILAAHNATSHKVESFETVDHKDEEIIPFSGIRKRIADNLMISKSTMADVTTFAEVNMARVKAFKEYLPLSYNAFILKATALALADHPIMNSSIIGDKIVIKKSIGLCVAVSTPRGLLTPVIHGAEKLNLIDIAEQLQDYADRGRAGKLTSLDLEGGSFTVTNSGTYGALFFTPIINAPQSAILGAGKISMIPIIDEKGAIVAAPMMILCLSYDHRVVDGEDAVKFLQRVKHYLENPHQMTDIKKK